MMSADMDIEGEPAAAPATAPSPSTIEELLKANALYSVGVASALEYITVSSWEPLSQELFFLKNMQPLGLQPGQAEAALNCGMQLYSLHGSPRPDDLLGLTKRTSNLFAERDFFEALYATMIDKWKKQRSEKIILSGNAGIGKSWFQVYVLRRLLRERQDAMFDFVVRHIGRLFYFLDLDTASGYKIEGSELMTLLGSHGRILYLYEPAGEINQPPLTVSAASLSTLSPRPNRIQEYAKSQPTMLYMPLWNFNELELIAALEIQTPEEWIVFDDNLLVFGGIARYTLQFDSSKKKTNKEKVDTRCGAVTAGMLRSLAADIDDDPKSENRNNLSGFVASYDVPRDGDNRFEKAGLTMTSEYARKTVLDRMRLQSVQEHLLQFAKHLACKSKDITGKDLEVSVVNLLASGPMTVPWEYHAVGGTTKNGTALPHTERAINRQPDYDQSMVNYPADKSFPLIDCYLVINGLFWAFQTTWQYNHAFKLGTLLKFRKNVGLQPGAPLNILFVNPFYSETYRKRAKNDYLVKGERADEPLLDHSKNTLLDAIVDWLNIRDRLALAVSNKSLRTFVERVSLSYCQDLFLINAMRSGTNTGLKSKGGGGSSTQKGCYYYLPLRHAFCDAAWDVLNGKDLVVLSSGKQHQQSHGVVSQAATVTSPPKGEHPHPLAFKRGLFSTPTL